MRGTVTGYVGQVSKAEVVNGGSFLLAFSVAEKVYSKSNPDAVCWHQCAYFGKRAESIAHFIGKGSFVAVTGQCQLDEYGEGRASLKVHVDDVVLGPKTGAASHDGGRKPVEDVAPTKTSYDPPEDVW